MGTDIFAKLSNIFAAFLIMFQISIVDMAGGIVAQPLVDNTTRIADLKGEVSDTGDTAHPMALLSQGQILHASATIGDVKLSEPPVLQLAVVPVTLHPGEYAA